VYERGDIGHSRHCGHVKNSLMGADGKRLGETAADATRTCYDQNSHGKGS